MTTDDLATTAKTIIDTNLYMTLATADEAGQPWVSPVYYATSGYTDFYWISSPEVTHSRNLAARPQVSVVIFDSQSPIGAGGERAVYLTAVAEQLAGDDIERGLAVYPKAVHRTDWSLTPAELRRPAAYRLYRARVSERSMLCPRDRGRPCLVHGRAFDHRIDLTV
jgi:nitroimidazol reductase NimA-like FMN-containing flavoprotein (pyridoxamine 5'-phosphate oxidase superfamily)